MNHFQLHQQNGVPFLVCQPLQHAGFIHAFSTRQGGVSPLPAKALNLGYFKGDARENVTENRSRFLAAFGASEMKTVTMRQLHSDHVIVIRHPQDAATQVPNQGDALIAHVSGLLLGVQTADCVPILIADPKRRALAAVHAGWRGTLARIAEKAIARMQAEFGTRPEDCLAAIGPSAGVCCYEVDDDVTEPFRAEFSFGDSIIPNHNPNGKAHLDVPGCNLQQLLSAGLTESHLYSSGFCTLCRNDLFFSYRRERDQCAGRMMSVIGMR